MLECNNCHRLYGETIQSGTDECPDCGHKGRKLKSTTGETMWSNWYSIRREVDA